MRKVISLLAICFVVMHVQAQYKETRTIKDFDEIRVVGPFEVELIEEQNNQLMIESEEIDLHKIVTEMDGTALKIRSAAAFTAQKTIKIKVHYDILREVSSSAGAIVWSNKPIYGDKIELRAASGGRMEFQLEMEKIDLKASQGAEVMLEGRTKDAVIKCTTGAKVNTSELRSEKVYVESTTGATVEVHAVKKLDAHATSKGEIIYKGEPTTLIDDVKLKGSIKKKG